MDEEEDSFMRASELMAAEADRARARDSRSRSPPPYPNREDRQLPPRSREYRRRALPRPHDELLDLAPLLQAKRGKPDLQLPPPALPSLVAAPATTTEPSATVVARDFEGLLSQVPTKEQKERQRAAERKMEPLMAAYRECLARMNIQGKDATDSFETFEAAVQDIAMALLQTPQEQMLPLLQVLFARHVVQHVQEKRRAGGVNPKQQTERKALDVRGRETTVATVPGGATIPDYLIRGAQKLPTAELFQETKARGAADKDKLTVPGLQDRMIDLTGQQQSIEEHQARNDNLQDAGTDEIKDYLSALAARLGP